MKIIDGELPVAKTQE
jgi:hypothetical protein